MATGTLPVATFQRRISYTRISLLRVLLYMILVTLASCTSGSESDNGLLTREEYRLALSDTLRTAEWPANYQPDVDRIVERTYPDDGAVQEGMEVTIHSAFLVCAWSIEYMDSYRTGNSESQGAAIEILSEQIPSSPRVNDEMSDLSLRIGNNARIGDIEEMTGFLNQNCYPLNWIENPVSGPPSTAQRRSTL